ncbi:MAG: metallophosphoesterase [Chloroflexi bacterium]|nr:metallophosphoesterase [Chloroflexota bacterium]MBU1751351.1 metallophosphoesterase [Chloroflexota bacterium]
MFRVRTILVAVLVVAALASAGLVLWWVFSVDGTLGLYQWMPSYRVAFYLVGLLGVLPALVALTAVVVGRFFARVGRIVIVLAVLLALVGIVVPLGVAGYIWQTSTELAGTTPPVLLVQDGVGAHGVPDLALVFRTDPASQNTLYYGVDDLSESVTEAQPTGAHVMVLRDLQPATRYQWRLNDGPARSFLTPATDPAADVLYHFGASGDSHFGADTAQQPQIAQSILGYVRQPAHQFHTFFVLGDIADMGMENDKWTFALDTLSPFSYDVPLRPFLGNHDTLINGVEHYFAYFYSSGMATPQGTSRYYRIDAGTVHVITLEMLWGVDMFTPQQKEWFIRQLESIPATDWVIVMMHSMVYSSGIKLEGIPWYDPADMIREVAPLLEQYQVDLVLSGHNHHLEFLQHNGVSYVVVGGLGGPLDPAPEYRSPASLWYRDGTFGFADVTVRPERIDLEFRDATGVELQSFTIGQNQ